MGGCGCVGTSTRSGKAGVEGGRVFVGGCRNSRRRGRRGVVVEGGGASGGVSRGVSFGHVRCWASCAVCSSGCWQRAGSRYGASPGQQAGQKRDVAERGDGRRNKTAGPHAARLIGGYVWERVGAASAKAGDGGRWRG
jgi:hypothetical protein